MFGRRLSSAVFLRQFPQFEMRSALHPHAALDGERFVEIRARLDATSEGSARRAAFIPPQRGLAEHPRTRVVRESCKAVAQKTFGIGGSSCPEARRAALEPHQPVSRKLIAERRKQLERVVVPSLSVVKQEERESCVLLVVAG